jgi:hypothetical protein
VHQFHSFAGLWVACGDEGDQGFLVLRFQGGEGFCDTSIFAFLLNRSTGV